MKVFHTILLSCVIIFASGQSQNKAALPSDVAKITITPIASLPKHIKEASGLEMSKSGLLWTHNDGGLPMLFCFDTLGNLIRSIQLNHPNAGWESLAMDKDGKLYLGAFGNNKNDKRELKIYILPDPESITDRVFTAQIIRYKYRSQREYPAADSDKNYDVDALVAMDDALYLFSKNRTKPFTGYTRIYKLPKVAGTYQAEMVDSVYLGKGPMIDCWVTGADLSPDGKTLALLSHQHLWLIKNFKPGQFSAGSIQKVSLEHFSHKAGITFSGNNQLYIVDEREFDLIGGKLYRADLLLDPAKLQ